MISRRFLIFILLVALLVACETDEKGKGGETAVSHLSPTATATTLTPTPTVITSPKIIPTATTELINEPVSPLLLLKTPSPTPFVTETPFPPTATPIPLPTIKLEHDLYQLRSPDPDTILDILAYASGQTSLYSSREDFADEVIARVPSTLHDLLLADLRQYYPNGLPNAQKFVAEQHLNFHPMPPPVVTKIVRKGLLDLLNEQNFPLVSGEEIDFFNFQLFPFQVEIDGDSNPEWIVKYILESHGTKDILALEQDSTGKYQIIPNDFLPEFPFRDYQVETSYDFTGDGHTDIVVTQYDYLLAGQYGGYVKVFTWNGQRIAQFTDIRYHEFYTHGNAYFEIKDDNQNGRYEIHITHSKYDNYGCFWETTDIFQWWGKEEQHTYGAKQPPPTPECLVAQALNRNNGKSISQRIANLEQALPLFNEENTPSLDYIALINLRLAWFNAQIKQDSRAWHYLSIIQDLPDSPLLQYIRPIIAKNNSGSLFSLCSELYSLTDGFEVYLGTDIDDEISLAQGGAYPLSGGTYPGALCDSRTLIETRSTLTPLPITYSVSQVLDALTVSAALSQTLNLDDDAADEWLGIIDVHPRLLLFLDKKGDVWQAKFIEMNQGVENWQILEHNLSGKVRKETVLLLKHVNSNDYSFFLLGSTQNGVGILERGYFYQVEEPPNIQEVSLNDFSFPQRDEAPDYIRAIESELENETGFWTYMRHLSNQVITQEGNRAAQSEIENLIVNLPINEIGSWQLHNQLTYLLGYQHELAGNETEAITIYLDLIQQAPSSPWSWLAWARLEPIES